MIRIVTTAAALAITLPAHAGLLNTGFETTLVAVPDNGYIIAHQSNVPGWFTTSSDQAIEIWDDGFSGLGYPGFPITAYEGQKFAEINATQDAMLYQESTGIAAGQEVDFHFAYRGRAGVDTMRLTITDLGTDGVFGSSDDTLLFDKEYLTGNLDWGYYISAAESPIVALGNSIRFGYASVREASATTPGTWALMLGGLAYKQPGLDN